MDAKTRYRNRLKLQAALTRVIELMNDNAEAGIVPDRTTALVAWQLSARLQLFVKAAIPDPAELPVKRDLSRPIKLIQSRKKETAARYGRKKSGRK